MRTIVIKTKAFVWSFNCYEQSCYALLPGSDDPEEQWFEFELSEGSFAGDQHGELFFGETQLFEIEVEIPASIKVVGGK